MSTSIQTTILIAAKRVRRLRRLFPCRLRAPRRAKGEESISRRPGQSWTHGFGRFSG